jgi:hypothetical protein
VVASRQVAYRLYILSRVALAPEDVVARARRELDAADWWTCAEWAGYDDDDEARVVVDRLLATMQVRLRDAPPALDVEFNSNGAVRFEAIGVERTRVLADRVDG